MGGRSVPEASSPQHTLQRGVAYHAGALCEVMKGGEGRALVCQLQVKGRVRGLDCTKEDAAFITEMNELEGR